MSVINTFGIAKVNGDVGIEIEVEGRNLPTAIDSNLWKPEADGSLRDGVEYVLRRPILIGTVKKALVSLKAIFEMHESQLDFSHRTSVHVHVNISAMELYDLKKFVFCAYLMDTIFSHIGEREIKGNRFALRIRDAGGIYFTLSDFFKQNVIPDIGQAKYSIINICPISRYGSVEFRAMHGNMDVDTIDNWCKLLVSLRDGATKFKTISEAYELAAYRPKAFIEFLIPDDVLKFFQYEGMEQDVQDNLSLLAGLHTIRG